MNLRLCIVSASPEIFADAAHHAASNAHGDVSLCGFGNGGPPLPLGHVPPQYVKTTIRNVPENIGVPAALHQLWEMAKSMAEPGANPADEIVAYIHDDVRILEPGWDIRVKAAFERDARVGLVGFGGSTGLGADNIYKVAYEIHQLGRTNFFSNMVGAELHGTRTTTEMPAVSFDGFSMIVRRSLLDTINGWSWWPFGIVHHAYDYGIACMNRRHGYSAWLVPLACEHRGGLTACSPIHQEMAKKHGGDSEVHRIAHEFVYNTFRDVLPLRLG